MTRNSNCRPPRSLALRPECLFPDVHHDARRHASADPRGKSENIHDRSILSVWKLNKLRCLIETLQAEVGFTWPRNASLSLHPGVGTWWLVKTTRLAQAVCHPHPCRAWELRRSVPGWCPLTLLCSPHCLRSFLGVWGVDCCGPNCCLEILGTSLERSLIFCFCRVVSRTQILLVTAGVPAPPGWGVGPAPGELSCQGPWVAVLFCDAPANGMEICGLGNVLF